MGFPLLLKANIGGSGAGIVRYERREDLEVAVRERFLPDSVDKVLLLQDHDDVGAALPQTSTDHAPDRSRPVDDHAHEIAS